MERDRISALYDEIWAVTQKMLDAAHNSDWELLISLEGSRRFVVQAVQELDVGSAQDQGHIAEVIQQILAADAECKTLTEKWMAELQGRLTSVGNERKLVQQYGPVP